MFANVFQRRLGLGLSGLGFSAALMMASGAGAQPITGAFSFQGELASGGTPAAGLHDMRFRLFDAASGGAQVGSVLCADNVQVAAGRFVTTLDFGANAFAGQRRFLEIDVRSDSGLNCANNAGFTTLGPRIEVGATPYATFAPTAGAAQTAASATNAASLNGQPASFYSSASNLSAGVLADARLSTNVPRLNAATSAFTGGVSATTLTGTHVGDGTGVTNLNASNVASGTLADARLSANVPRLNAANVFSGAMTAASFAGSGAGLVNLSASNVASGTLADARLSSNIPRLNAANTFALGMTINGDVGIGTSAPEAPLHVRGGGSLGGIVVTPDVTDTQSQILLAENTTASNAMLMRYNGTTNNLEFRGRAADVESAAHMTIGRDSGVVTVSGGLAIPATERSLWINATNFQIIFNGAYIWGNFATSISNTDVFGGTCRAVAGVSLPDGAVVTRVVVLADDTADVNATAKMRRFSYVNPDTLTTMATVSTSGTSGTQTRTDTSISSATIDLRTYIYDVELSIPRESEGNLFVYGVRIDYTIVTPLP
ncbi:hypothetical protein LBMAG48_30520 [Phycisphaerae bacterium]|nr:hypothetical protein LBMAG48_30520 [Phycisphaerae bacterium]